MDIPVIEFHTPTIMYVAAKGYRLQRRRGHVTLIPYRGNLYIHV